jgi:hypothetical protein
MIEPCSTASSRRPWGGIGGDNDAVPTPLPRGPLPAPAAAAACALDAADAAAELLRYLGRDLRWDPGASRPAG